MRVQRVVVAVCLCLGLLGTMGCGGGIQVSGAVTLSDGTPLTKGEVVFQSAAAVYKGALAASGKYTLDAAAGVVPGSYKVYVAGAGYIPPNFVPPPGIDDSGYISLVDDSFTTPESTPLSCDVSGTRTFDFEVKANPKKR